MQSSWFLTFWNINASISLVFMQKSQSSKLNWQFPQSLPQPENISVTNGHMVVSFCISAWMHGGRAGLYCGRAWLYGGRVRLYDAMIKGSLCCACNAHINTYKWRILSNPTVPSTKTYHLKQGLAILRFESRDRDWDFGNPGLKVETDTETFSIPVSMSRPRLRL